MAPQSETAQLETAWRALDGTASGQGWKVIDLADAGGCSILAGRRGPGNEESLLVGIPDINLNRDSPLPRGRGFSVMHTEHQIDTRALTWIAVVRLPEGQLPLFTLMSTDLVGLLRKIGSQSGSSVYVQLISRIKAWQRFMSAERSAYLSHEEEVGLVGELVVLKNIMCHGMQKVEAIEAWEGPEGGMHDFKIGAGVIETKTTLAPTGFIAQIGSLEQLDNNYVHPLYVAAVRLSLSDAGSSLPDIVDELLTLLAESGAEGLFESKLGSAGYLSVARNHYTRKFALKELAFRLVHDGTQCLTRSNVPAQIIEARYKIDLDCFPVVSSRFSDISDSLRTQN